MDGRVGSNDVSAGEIIIITFEAGEDSAGFFYYQRTGCDIPGCQAMFPETVEDSFCRPAEIQRGRPGAADARTSQEKFFESFQVDSQFILGSKGKSRGYEAVG